MLTITIQDFLSARENKTIQNKTLEDYFNINKEIYNIYIQ